MTLMTEEQKMLTELFNSRYIIQIMCNKHQYEFLESISADDGCSEFDELLDDKAVDLEIEHGIYENFTVHTTITLSTQQEIPLTFIYEIMERELVPIPAPE